MNNLLKDNMLDDFEVTNIELNTFTKFNISCDINKKYLSTDEIEILGDRDHIRWSEIKSIILYMIKGNKTPSYMKIIFSLPRNKIESILTKYSLPIKLDNINGLFINVLYENNVLKCTTGSSMNIFSLDKSLENHWDNSVKMLFKKHGIPL